MKKWRCDLCGRRSETKDNIIMNICSGCQEEMVIENQKDKKDG